MSNEVIDWLLKSDPSIRWQTKAYILENPEKAYIKDKQQIEKEGWGKKLLNLQESDGRWGGGLYGPKFVSTHYTLLLLRRMGILPNEHTQKGCSQLIKLGYIGGNEKDNRKETCITGMALSIFAHFRTQENYLPSMLDYLEDNLLEDGAWNCRFPRTESVRHSSMHTTMSVLEGLHELKFHYPKYGNKIDKLSSQANEFLLIHELFKSHRTKKVIDPNFLEISFPPRYKYNILSALDYFRSIKHEKDERMIDAIEQIKVKEKKGYWLKGKQMSGKKHFSLNQPRKPSEWNTLRALRVLKWWNNGE